MCRDNKAKQASIYTSMFTTNTIDYDDYLLSPNAYLQEKYFARLHPKPNQRVLEIGIGITSFLARAVQKHHVNAYGLDFVSPSLIAQKRNSPCELNLCRGDGEALPYKKESFDFVIAISVLEHFSDYDQAFKEIWRILKVNSTCLIEVPCKDFRFSLFARFKTFENLKTKEWFQKNQEISGHDYVRIPDRKEWKEFAAKNGFHIVYCHGSNIFLDSWMMYYFYSFVKMVQSAVIRFKKTKREKNDTAEVKGDRDTIDMGNNRAVQELPVKRNVNHSWKRRVAGFFWYEILLRSYWIVLKPERMLSKLPIGSAIYMRLKKNG